MTTDKELLLKDLCARVPYNPKGKIVNAINGAECEEWLTRTTFPLFTNPINNSRLYLRPLSCMTEEEYNEFFYISGFHYYDDLFICKKLAKKTAFIGETLDWLNFHHFDFRNLIERGLAIEAPEDMYNLK